MFSKALVDEIAAHLVPFRDIAEMQAQNAKLLQTIRALTLSHEAEMAEKDVAADAAARIADAPRRHRQRCLRWPAHVVEARRAIEWVAAGVYARLRGLAARLHSSTVADLQRPALLAARQYAGDAL